MKKFIVLTLLALVAFSTPSFSQRGDWFKRAMVLDNDPTYNARSTKLSNGRMTVYVDGYYRKIKQEGKNIDGIKSIPSLFFIISDSSVAPLNVYK